MRGLPLGSGSDINASVLGHSIRKIMRFVVLQPGVVQSVVHRVIHKYPGTVFNDDISHLFVDRGSLRGIGHCPDLLKQLVELRVHVVAVIGVWGTVLAIEKLKEILRIGIVCKPCEPEHLALPSLQLAQECRPVVVVWIENHAYLPYEINRQFRGFPRLRIGAAEINRKLKILPVRVLAFRIAGFGQQFLCPFQIEGVGGRLFVVAGDAGRDRPLGPDHSPVVETKPFL